MVNYWKLKVQNLETVWKFIYFLLCN